MDPTIELLRRDEDPTQLEIDSLLVDSRFILEYNNIPSIGTEIITGENKELYGDKDIYLALLEYRELYGRMKNFKTARYLGNPFEAISSRPFFLDRAASKIAGIDHVFNMLPKEGDDREIFRISDLAGAPGAMLEYMLWKIYLSGVDVDATTISLVSPPGNRWELDRSKLPGVREAFNSGKIHFSLGKDGTGDLTVPENIQQFALETRKRGYRDLVIADGGMDVENDPEKQENKNAHLILGEVLCALYVLKEGGMFVLKMYDSYNKFTADILCLLFRHFKKNIRYKPLTSRPANGEVYFIGINFTGLNISTRSLENIFTILRTKAPISSLDAVYTNININTDKTKKTEFISGFLPKQDQILTDYISNMNDYHARRQIHFLRYSIIVDELVSSNTKVRPNYPISYNLSRIYDIWNYPYSILSKPPIIPGSACNELDLTAYISYIAKELSASRALQGSYLTDLFSWLRYYISRGGTISTMLEGASRVEEDRNSYAKEWAYAEICMMKTTTDVEDIDKKKKKNANKTKEETPRRVLFLKEISKIANLSNDELSIGCSSLNYELKKNFNLRTIVAKGVDSFVAETAQITSNALLSLLTPQEKFGFRKPEARRNLEYKPYFLERAFVLLKRYESYRLFENAMKITWPVTVGLELYATLLTTSCDSFLSPVADIEAEFGAIDFPLRDDDDVLPEEGIVGVNFLYANETAIKDRLIRKILTCLERKCVVYVVSGEAIPAFEEERFAASRVVDEKSILNVVTGKSYEGRARMYILK